MTRIALLFSDRVVRGWVIQILGSAVFFALLIFFIANAYLNLRQQGTSFGYDFLWRPTRWDLSVSFVTQHASDPYWLTFLIGIVNTLVLAAVVIPAATTLGLAVAVCRLSDNPLLNWFSRAYISLFRNLPLPFQLFFWYATVTHLPSPRNAISIGGAAFLTNRGLTLPALHASPGMWFAISALVLGVATVIAGIRWEVAKALPIRTRAALVTVLTLLVPLGVLIIGGMPELDLPTLNGFRFDGGVTLSSEFTALLVSIVLFGSSYIAECIRGGVQSVPRGQIDAADAVGLTRRQTFWFVVLPEALPNFIPPLGNQYLFLVRATTLGVAVGYADLFMVASTAINQTGRSVEILVFVASIFLVINYLMTVAINLVNKSVSFHDRVRT